MCSVFEYSFFRLCYILPYVPAMAIFRHVTDVKLSIFRETQEMRATLIDSYLTVK